MQIAQLFTDSPLRNFTYIVHTERLAYVIDPYYPTQVQEFLTKNNLQLRAIINTHEHGDHTRGNRSLTQNTGCEVWTHPRAKNTVPNVARTLAHDDFIEISPTHRLRVWHTPGHTFAHICLLALHDTQPQAIITGDTVFNAGVGNCYNGGDPRTLFRTMQKFFFTLPDHVVLYPGHEYWQNNLKFTLNIEPNNTAARTFLASLAPHTPQDSLPLSRSVSITPDNSFPLSTIGDERKLNVFFRLNADDEHEAEKKFLLLRQKRDSW